jgi:hypothetical protein
MFSEAKVFDRSEERMPFSAYLKAGLFVLAAAAALFAAAGTVAIAGFWAYLAIFAVVMIRQPIQR